MQTVAETPLFIKQAAELFSEDERTELIEFLAANPEVGDEIPGAGGVRKMRFGAKGKGKRGGARVIHYWIAMTHRSMRCWPMARTKKPI